MFLFFVLFISKNITNFSDPKTPQQKIVRYCENIEYYEIRFEIQMSCMKTCVDETCPWNVDFDEGWRMRAEGVNVVKCRMSSKS
jgi:hypothetical protein